MLNCAVVILNWNGVHFLKEFLPVAIQNTSSRSEIIIADNASTDGSIEYLENEHPQTRVIRLDKNYGFTGGYNKSLVQIEARYFILLNSDVEVTPNWDSPLLDILDSRQDVGAVMPKMLSYFNHNEFEYAGAAGGFIDKYGYPFCRGRVFHTLENDYGQYDGEQEVFWATGACIAVRSNQYHELGGLDDVFFAHMEEIDFCWRLHHQNLKVISTSDSVVYHLGGGTLPKYSSTKSYLNFRNNLIVLYKNLPRKRFTSLYLMRLALDTVAAFYFLAFLNFSGFYIVFKAHAVFHQLRLKRKITRLEKVNPEPALINRNTVYLYFIKGKRSFKEIIS
jgi:GT2 family glycosyltransferase